MVNEVKQDQKSTDKEVPEELQRIVTVALAYITKLNKKGHSFSFHNEAYSKQSLLNDADALMKKIK